MMLPSDTFVTPFLHGRPRGHRSSRTKRGAGEKWRILY